MIETADRAGMDAVVTRNIKDYSKLKVQVYAPGDFLTMLYEPKEE